MMAIFWTTMAHGTIVLLVIAFRAMRIKENVSRYYAGKQMFRYRFTNKV